MHGNTHVPVAVGALHRHEVTGEPIFQLLTILAMPTMPTILTMLTMPTILTRLRGSLSSDYSPPTS
eukprot:scaffold90975_cov35-Phaeocystis_antarctica.AAC.1